MRLKSWVFVCCWLLCSFSLGGFASQEMEESLAFSWRECTLVPVMHGGATVEEMNRFGVLLATDQRAVLLRFEVLAGGLSKEAREDFFQGVRLMDSKERTFSSIRCGDPQREEEEPSGDTLSYDVMFVLPMWEDMGPLQLEIESIPEQRIPLSQIPRRSLDGTLVLPEDS